MRPEIAVVIPTRNRAERLDHCLGSFVGQSIGDQRMEILVIDDGSKDATAEVIGRWSGSLPLRGLRQAPSGASAARNLGLFASSAPLALFFDDDEEATADLLERHLEAHATFPGDHQAILGYTTWSPALRITAFMHYVVEVGCSLYSYPHLRPGTPLEYHHFWTGRISVKRSFLINKGVFSPRVARLEDVELGFRLRRHGLEIQYWPAARNFNPVPVRFREFCRRACVDGEALVRLLALHPTDPALAAYCDLEGAEERWRSERREIDAWMIQADRLERELAPRSWSSESGAFEPLWEIYRRSIAAHRDRGIVHGLRTSSSLNIR